MMENPRSREKKIIKDIRNLFRLKKNKMTQQLKVVKGIKGKIIKDTLRIFSSMKMKKEIVINQ